ncbi:MAG: PhoH family protein [Oligoflexales bacterium]
MKKVFILDTNVLLGNPLSIFKFDEHDVVIPISVIEEVDNFKKDQSDIGRNARELSRLLDGLRSKGTLSSGIHLFKDRKDSGRLFVYLGHNMDILPELLQSNTDNHILAIGLTLQKQFGAGRKVVVITKDSNLRIKADAFGLAAEDFEADKVDISDLYTGVQTMRVNSKVISDFYVKREQRIKDHDFHANQFIILEDENDPSQFVYGLYSSAEDQVKMIEPRNDGVWGIYPRNIEQTFAMEALLDDKFRLVTISGGAGTGKTLLAIAAGLYKTTDEDLYQKLLVSRPIFPLGKDIGFLPGDLEEKLNPWMQPIFDNLELLLGTGGGSSRRKGMSRGYQELINQGMLAIEPLTYIRGRSIPNQFFIVDEAQNLTPHEIKTILTRAGEGTKIVFTGDPYQIDNPYLDSQSNGLTNVIERFKKDDISAHITLTKGERSALATRAAELL